MPISEGTSAELATIIAQINVVVDELAEKERQLEAIRNLDPQVAKMLPSQGDSSRKIRNVADHPAVPGQDPLDMEEQMELGARQRELERKQQQNG
ncbi:hypothetical protein BBAD15_g11699 [Beauveria bassiana D1-5]|uniref:Uncharacterized protein n=1 Tax=Beauveria bassiana D1-5 TaxID=1245745 RepID=A0A0A2V6F2_BEABA|nr:hypothetical protein BBAD15_g11699 [Beauveria bassiana D1-5]